MPRFEERRRFGGFREGGFRDRGFRESRPILPKPIKVGEKHDVEISGVGTRGDGITKIKDFVVFVPNTKKGDKVQIEIKEVRDRFAVGEKVGEAEAVKEAEKPEEAVKEVAEEEAEDVAEEIPEPVEEEKEEELTEETPETEEEVTEEETEE